MKAKQIDKAYRSAVYNHTNRAVSQEKKVVDDGQLFVEKLEENILIEIPGDIPSMELPAVLSAVHYYRTTAFQKNDAWSSVRKNYRRDLTLNLDVICSSRQMQEIIASTLNVCLTRPVDVYSYDMYHRFDSNVIELFKANRKFHASSAYGITMGCEAQSLFEIPVNDIITNVENRVPIDILVLDEEKVWQWIGETVPNLTVSKLLSNENSFRAMIAALNDSKLVVGNTSMYTYFACCMKKPVFEIYPEGLSRNWLSKWSNPNYAMYVSNEPAKDVLLKGVSHLWQKSKQLVR